MNDRLIDTELETRLSSAFRGRELPAAPGRLVDSLERVPDAPVTGGQLGRTRQATGRRTTIGLLGLAAVLAVGGALVVGGGGLLRNPSPTPSAIPGTIVTYSVAWTSETPADAATLADLVGILRERVATPRAVGVSVKSVGMDRVVVGIPAGLDVDAVRNLVGQRGEAAFVPLGTESAEEGDPVNLTENPPLFGSDGVTGASVDANETGNRVVNFELAPEAATLFSEYTADHIGDYFAITIDGVVLSAPVIQSHIPGGNVQISKDGTIGGFPLEEASRLVAVLRAGPLPVALVEVGSAPRPIEPEPISPSAVPTDPALESPSVVAGDPLVVCGPRLPVGGQQLECDRAVAEALPVLPAEHPLVSRIEFGHQCLLPENPGAAVDCVIQAMGVVTFTFADGSRPLRVFVSLGAPAQIVADAPPS